MWQQQALKYAKEGIPFFLVGNRMVSPPCHPATNSQDLPNRTVSREEGLQVAKELGMMYYETSAANGKNVGELFTELAYVIQENQKAKTDQPLYAQDEESL